MKIFGRFWVWGAVGGFTLATLITVVSFFGLMEETGLEGVRNFFSALPVFLVSRLWRGAPEFFLVAMLFVYWIILGALVGWGFGKGKAWKIGVAIALPILLFGHLLTKSIMERELEGAVRAFGTFIQQSLQKGDKMQTDSNH